MLNKNEVVNKKYELRGRIKKLVPPKPAFKLKFHECGNMTKVLIDSLKLKLQSPDERGLRKNQDLKTNTISKKNIIEINISIFLIPVLYLF